MAVATAACMRPTGPPERLARALPLAPAFTPARAPLSTGLRIGAASFLAAGAKVEPLFPVVGDPLGVLDHVAVHVGDPECAVGAGLEHGRPEPVVARRQELAR